MRTMGQHDDAGQPAAVARQADSTRGTPRPHGRSPRLEPASPPDGAEAVAARSGVERLCVERGLKMTGQRRTIARVLTDASDHPDVEELYRRAVLLDPRISIATVYRTVRLFEDKGILQRRDFGNGRARYEPTEHGPHYHLIDVETGKVVEFKNSEHERLIRALAEQLGFHVISLRLEVFGKRLDAQPASGRVENGTDPSAR